LRISDWSSDVCSSDLSPTLLTARPLRSIRDLTDHVILHADEGREWQTWLAAAKALELGKGPHHFMGDARLAMEAALHGNGIALGDTMTASSLMQKGSLVRSEEHTSELQSLMRISYHVFCLNKKHRS